MSCGFYVYLANEGRNENIHTIFVHLIFQKNTTSHIHIIIAFIKITNVKWIYSITNRLISHCRLWKNDCPENDIRPGSIVNTMIAIKIIITITKQWTTWSMNLSTIVKSIFSTTVKFNYVDELKNTRTYIIPKPISEKFTTNDDRTILS